VEQDDGDDEEEEAQNVIVHGLHDIIRAGEDV
jgi:hypothetical protein